MEELSLKVVSHQDELELTEGAVLIRKKGLANILASGMNGERSIDIRQIAAIDFKRGGTFSPGFIQFSYAGGKPFRGGLIEATQDPDAFVFEKALNDQVQALKTELEERIERVRSKPEGASEGSLAKEIAGLVSLRNAGDLTQDEFQKAKDKLLGS